MGFYVGGKIGPIGYSARLGGRSRASSGDGGSDPVGEVLVLLALGILIGIAAGVARIAGWFGASDEYAGYLGMGAALYLGLGSISMGLTRFTDGTDDSDTAITWTFAILAGLLAAATISMPFVPEDADMMGIGWWILAALLVAPIIWFNRRIRRWQGGQSRALMTAPVEERTGAADRAADVSGHMSTKVEALDERAQLDAIRAADRLREQGALTQEEFELMKSRILGNTS